MFQQGLEKQEGLEDPRSQVPQCSRSSQDPLSACGQATGRFSTFIYALLESAGGSFGQLVRCSSGVEFTEDLIRMAVEALDDHNHLATHHRSCSSSLFRTIITTLSFSRLAGVVSITIHLASVFPHKQATTTVMATSLLCMGRWGYLWSCF